MRWFRLGPGSEEDLPRSNGEAWNLNGDLQRLGRLAQKEWPTLSLGICFLLVAAGIKTIIPQAVAQTLVAALKAGSGEASQLALNAAAKRLAILAMTFGLMSGLRGLLMSIAENKLLLHLRRQTFSRMLQQDIAFHDSRDVGELTSRLNSDCEAVASGLSVNFNIFLRSGVQLVFGVIYLAYTSWRLSLILVVVWAALFYVYTVYGRFTRRSSMLRQDRLAGLSIVATEALQNVRTLRSLACEGAMLEKYEDASAQLIFLDHQRAAAYGIYATFYNGLTEGIKAVALAAGGILVASGGMNAEQLTASMFYVDSVVASSLNVGSQYRQMMSSIGSSRKVFELSEMPPSKSVVAEGGLRIASQDLRTAIAFRNVTFSYPTRPGDMVLRGLDLDLVPGSVTAIVGSSGSGKSTVAALLQRWYEPTSGEVLLDEVPIKDLDPKWLRSLLGVVTQDPRLFTATVWQNIALGLVGTTAVAELTAGSDNSQTEADTVDRLVREAAKSAGAHGFIMSLPKGYDTMVGDVRLSGGQRQRIALARALVRQPHILILDEATSALDRNSESLVQASVNAYLKRRKATCLVIAHRLSTIVDADRIVVLDEGKVAEQGTHKELLRKHGSLYSKLVRGGAQ